MRRLVLGFLALVVGSCAPAPAHAWTADTGICGTYNHFGPPTYLCGVAYDLRYQGSEPLEDLDVLVRFPDGFAAHRANADAYNPTGWRRPSLPASGPGSLADAARLGHASGDVGAVCKSGPEDLSSLRGTILRVSWHTAPGDHEEQFTIDDVRGDVTFYAGQLSPDGQLRIEWPAR